MNCICIIQVSEPYQTLVSLRQSILCNYDNVTFLWGGCLICLIVLVVKLLTGFDAFGLTSDVQILKGVGVSTVQ